MKKIFPIFVIVFSLLIGTHELLYSWGFFAHKRINRLAVFTLPKDMVKFYKIHIEYITENAVAPDRRRHAMPNEPPRHYIDIDHYGVNPLDSMPRKWKDAVAKYSEDTLLAYGIVPWHIVKTTKWLTEAFRKKDIDKILYHSVDLGHYIGDSHVPLHCTENYNGQMTNQKGIHGFWESRLPELFSDNYDFFVGKAIYIDFPLDYAWTIVEASFNAKDSVLEMEAELNERYSPDLKYTYENRGQSLLKVYSEEYSKEYHKILDGMVERRMRASIHAIGSFWYTAWVNAGKPDLESLMDKQMSKALKKQLKEEERMWRTGKIYGRDHQD
ncbi:MAG TPA: S1/P1 Nuclease [Flavobacteriales bacterium]|nr:S1/P1 Nuclease [Flavobacteriales bacterium]HIN40262.1 S1/P1 Nuclease [Flavobacteriales bacterium]